MKPANCSKDCILNAIIPKQHARVCHKHGIKTGASVPPRTSRLSTHRSSARRHPASQCPPLCRSPATSTPAGKRWTQRTASCPTLPPQLSPPQGSRRLTMWRVNQVQIREIMSVPFFLPDKLQQARCARVPLMSGTKASRGRTPSPPPNAPAKASKLPRLPSFACVS